jgi:hypothetical protein
MALLSFVESAPRAYRLKASNAFRLFQHPPAHQHITRRNVGNSRTAGNQIGKRTTELYDRRRDEMSLDEVEKISI